MRHRLLLARGGAQLLLRPRRASVAVVVGAQQPEAVGAHERFHGPERATQPCTVVPFFPLSRPRRGRVLGHGQDTKCRRRNEISPSPMTQYLILRDLAVIFAVSLLVILLFHRLKLPALPGFIVAGVLLGPNALGLVSDVHQVESLAE